MEEEVVKKKMNEFKNKYGIKNIFYDYDELLNSDVYTIYIALPNNLHFEFSKKALEANKNIIWWGFNGFKYL